MALDKVVDSADLDAGMTLVADAIRAKAGTTEPLAWPDGFAAGIAGLLTGSGSGLPTGISQIAFAQFIPAADTANTDGYFEIKHNFGVKPDVVLVSSVPVFTNDKTIYFGCLYDKDMFGGSCVVFRGATSMGSLVGQVANSTYNIELHDENTIRLRTNAATVVYAGGVTYSVIMMVREG